MRLPEARVLQGILHADREVRFAALQYFGRSFSRSPAVMPVVIEAFDRWGFADAFVHKFPISDLVQTNQTIAWAIEQLQRFSGQDETDDNHRYHLSRLLCHADPQLLIPHEATILESPGFNRDLAECFTTRLRLLVLDSDSLWRDLEEICEEGKDKQYVTEIRYNQGKWIVEALARDGANAARMMSLLGQVVTDYDDNPMKWMEIFVTIMAGEMRHAAATPYLIEKLHEDGDISNEECLTALVKIQTDDVVEAVREAYPDAENYFRLFASGVFGRIHSDAAVAVGIELLEMEQDLEQQEFLAQELLDQFSTEVNEAVRQIVLDDPDVLFLKRSLVTACTLMEQDFPELDEWRTDAQEQFSPRPLWDLFWQSEPSSQAASTERIDGPVSEPIRSSKTAGRNDPCPCGSGKKFKKCCLHKTKAVP